MVSTKKDGVPIEVIPGEKLDEYGLLKIDNEEEYFPIAIVGMGCRYPGAYSLKEYRDVLMNKLTTYSELPEVGRWHRKEWTDKSNSKLPGSHDCPTIGLLPTKRAFDNSFFNISPKEAQAMEPQQHDTMEVTHEALEDGGFTARNPLPQNTSVYLSMRMGDTVPPVSENPNMMTPYILTGGAHTTLANRVNFFWDLRGPSMGVEGSDSAATHSIHFSIWALWNRECHASIAGGCNGILHPLFHIALDDYGHLSKSGECRPMDAQADGKIRSEGCGIVILRPLADALNAKNHIHCVIRASAVGFNGSSSTLGEVSMESISQTIGNTYNRFGIPPEMVDFVELSASGKIDEDIMETEAVSQVFHKKSIKVGSAKANVGNSEMASGACQLMKAALMLSNREILPQTNFEKPHPEIAKLGNIQVPTDYEKYEGKKNMMIGVNSIAIAGQICHMVLEEFKNEKKKLGEDDLAGWFFGKKGQSGRYLPFVFSAKTKDALHDLIVKWKSFEWEHDDAQVVSSWLATHRDYYNHRVVILANSTEDFLEKADLFLNGTPCDEVIDGNVNQETKPKICFVFPGQGQQWWHMGRELYANESVFKKFVDECDHFWAIHSGFSFLERDRTFVKDFSDRNPEDIDNIITAQPAIVANQIALYELVRSWGLQPDIIVGHSLGEVAAAYAAGGLSLEECMSSIYVRATTQTKLAGTGSMAAARFSPEEAEEFVKKYDDLYVACYNSTDNVTVAGGTGIVNKLAGELPKTLKVIRVQAAFHTCHLNPVKDMFDEMIKGKIEDRKTSDKAVFYSTVTKDAYQGPFNASYWWTNVAEPVFFTQASKAIFRDHGDDVLFVEIGSSATMLSSLRQSAKKLGVSPAGYIHFGLRNKNDHLAAMKGFAQLHTMAYPLDWTRITRDAASYVPIPTYPFQRTYYDFVCHAFKERMLDTRDKSYHARKGKINESEQPWLFRMQYNDQTIFAPSAIVEYFAEMCEGDICLKEISIRDEPCPISGIRNNGEFWYNMITEKKFASQFWLVDQKGKYLAEAIKLDAPVKTIPQSFDVQMMASKFASRMSSEEAYDLIARMGISVEGEVRQIQAIAVGDGEAVACLSPPNSKFELLHTMNLESAFQVALVAFSLGTSTKRVSKVKYVQATVPKVPLEDVYVYTILRDWSLSEMEADIYLTSPTGQVLVAAEGCVFSSFASEITDFNKYLYIVKDKINTFQLQPKKPINNWEYDDCKKLYISSKKPLLQQDDVKVRVKAVCSSGIPSQCSGVIEEVGTNVCDLNVGDEVIVVQTSEKIRSLVVCDKSRIIPKPKGMSWAEASSFGVTYGLAHMTLVDTCDIDSEKRVFIYGSDNTVGQAFVAVAMAFGADVITCGSDKSAHLSICSETLYDDFKTLLKGSEVDIIINTQTGALPHSLLDFVSFDCFLCAMSSSKVEVTPFAMDPRVTYCTIDADDSTKRNVQELKNHILLAAKLLTEKKIPSLKIEATELPNLPGASDVSTISIPNSFLPSELQHGELEIETGATYIINDAFSGLGMCLAKWLVLRGATKLCLVSTDEADTCQRRFHLRALRNEGIAVQVLRMDVNDKKNVVNMLDDLTMNGNKNIKGIFYLALKPVTSAASGAEHIHSELLRRKISLQHFVTFSLYSLKSSASSAPITQALDKLAVERSAQNLPGINFHVSAINSISLIDPYQRTECGAKSLDVTQWLACVERVLLQEQKLPSSVAIADQDWSAAYNDSSSDKELFQHLVDMKDAEYKANVNERIYERILKEAEEFLNDTLMLSDYGLPLEMEVPLMEIGTDRYLTDFMNRFFEPKYKTKITWEEVKKGMTGVEMVHKIFSAVKV